MQETDRLDNETLLHNSKETPDYKKSEDFRKNLSGLLRIQRKRELEKENKRKCKYEYSLNSVSLPCWAPKKTYDRIDCGCTDSEKDKIPLSTFGRKLRLYDRITVKRGEIPHVDHHTACLLSAEIPHVDHHTACLLSAEIPHVDHHTACSLADEAPGDLILVEIGKKYRSEQVCLVLSFSGGGKEKIFDVPSMPKGYISQYKLTAYRSRLYLQRQYRLSISPPNSRPNYELFLLEEEGLVQCVVDDVPLAEAMGGCLVDKSWSQETLLLTPPGGGYIIRIGDLGPFTRRDSPGKFPGMSVFEGNCETLSCGWTPHYDSEIFFLDKRARIWGIARRNHFYLAPKIFVLAPDFHLAFKKKLERSRSALFIFSPPPAVGEEGEEGDVCLSCVVGEYRQVTKHQVLSLTPVDI